MTKVWWHKLGECITTEQLGLGKLLNVSSFPRRKYTKVYLWNDSPLPPVMLTVALGVLMFCGVKATAMTESDSNRSHDFLNTQPQVQEGFPLPLSSSFTNQSVPLVGKRIIKVYDCLEGDTSTKDTENVSKIKSEFHENDNEAHFLQIASENVESFRIWTPNEMLLENKEAGKTTEFRLYPRPFSCTGNEILKTFHWHPTENDMLKIQDSSFPTISNMSLLENGNLVWNKAKGQLHVYRKEQFCISRNNDWVSFTVCMSTSTCSKVSPCVNKCCPPSYVINKDTRECVKSFEEWRPLYYKNENVQERDIHSTATNALIVVGFPSCQKKYVIHNAGSLQNFKLQFNGSLLLKNGANHAKIDRGVFCIDGIFNGENAEGNPVHYSGSEWDQVVIACTPNNTVRAEMETWRINLYASLNCVSAVFLLLTDIVYLLLWRHQNIHGWLQFSYATSLFCTFNCFVIVQWWSDELNKNSRVPCKIMGYLSHLTYLSAFFWLTSMNFDLWWRFSRPLRNSRIRPQVKKFKRFLGFAAFSIGIPVLICCIGITLDTIYDKLDAPFMVPGFGKEKCYFENKRSQVPYLYGPAAVLLLVDLIFFTSTVLHLRKIHAHTELARTQSTMEDKRGLRVFAKLFVVMGVLWVFELVPWVAHIIFPDQETIVWAFIPIDVLNCLQGVAIFFTLVVCKPNVMNQLMALFQKDDAAMTWNKQTQLPSVATVQQTIRPNDYADMK